MNLFSWFKEDEEKHHRRLREARERLKEAELTDEEVRELLEALDRERRKNNYAEMVVGAFIPRGK